MGTMAKAAKAGTIERYGARRNTRLSAPAGSRSSLKKSLVPSARVWRIPHGPARSGPIRFCMSEMTLRSNHTMNITAISRNTKTTITFSSTISTTARSTPLAKRGSPTVVSSVIEGSAPLPPSPPARR